MAAACTGQGNSFGMSRSILGKGHTRSSKPEVAGVTEAVQACLNALGAQVCAARAQLEQCLRFWT